MRFLIVSTLMASSLIAAFQANAQKSASGSVIEHSGEIGELIVSRDGVVYWLSEGDDLFDDDILRAQNAESATITFRGCVFTLPEREDVTLDDEFCVAAVTEEPSMAAIASESGNVVSETAVLATGANAPLIVGGVVLSAGGIAAATNGGGGGTGSAASAAAGAAQANTVSGS